MLFRYRASFRLLPLLATAILLHAADTPAPATTPPPAPRSASDADEDHDDAGNAAKAKPDPVAPKFWEAIKLLGAKSPADQAKGRTTLQAASDLEYVHAQVLLANCYLSGSYGFPKDARKAANLFRLAAERGNAFAIVSLGSCYATGTGIRADDATATTWLTAALDPKADYSRPVPPADYQAPENDATVAGELESDPIASSQATAHFLLGQIFTRQKKTTEAQPHFVAAATAGADGRAGIYSAAVQAALNYALGQGVARDQAKANEMLEQSRKLTARMGVALIHNYVSLKVVDEFAVADLEENIAQAGEGYQSAVQLQIAQVFADKKSKDYNLAEAAKWYELAANNNQVWAMLQLGLMHARGELGAADPTQAFQWFEKAGGGEKPKHYLGVANLGICYQNGFGTAKDPAKAAALFKKYREYDIICYLGSMGQCPPAPVTFEEAVKLNETWAKQKNDPTAQYLLSLRYFNGWGVKADRDEGLKWAKKAAKAKHGEALNLLGLAAENTTTTIADYSFTSTEDAQKALDYYRRGSEVGNADATGNYARMLYQGKGTARDMAKAEALYLKSLQLDPENAISHNNLADVYADKLAAIVDNTDGDRIREYRAAMLKHFEDGIRLKYALAARNLGNIYYDGKLVKQDYSKAYRYYEQATEWGDPQAHFQLGLMHEQGNGVPVTLTEAAYHYRLAALDGNVEALRHLINFYLTGQGVSVDLDRAAFWLQRMVQLGYPGVLKTLADIMLKKGNYTEAVALLTKLTEFQSDVVSGFAYERLSECYAKGLGVTANPAKAKKYFNLAVQQGDGTALTSLALDQIGRGKIAEGIASLERASDTSGPACFYLGQMYFFGTHVKQDRPTAMKFLHEAAEKNHTEALYFLAAMTFNREADAPVLDDAIRLAQQAENLGLEKATPLREKLERRKKSAGETTEEKTKARSS